MTDLASPAWVNARNARTDSTAERQEWIHAARRMKDVLLDITVKPE